MKNRYIFLITISLGLIFFSGHSALAYSCANVPASGDYTLNDSCIFSGSVNGVEDGNLIIPAGKTLTVDSGQIVVWNPGHSITISGSIAMSGGQLKKGYIYVSTGTKDSDGDNYVSDVTQYFVGLSDAPPSNTKRRKDLGATKIIAASPDCNDSNPNVFQNISNLSTDADRDGYTASTSGSTQCVGNKDANGYYKDASGNYTYRTPSSSADCNDSSSYVFRNIPGLALDADHDGYTTSTSGSTKCVGSVATISDKTYYRDADGSFKWVSPSSKTDCCDSDADANPDQINWFTSIDACGSWDYNCNGTIDYQYWTKSDKCIGGGPILMDDRFQSLGCLIGSFGDNSSKYRNLAIRINLGCPAGFGSNPGCGHSGTFYSTGECLSDVKDPNGFSPCSYTNSTTSTKTQACH